MSCFGKETLSQLIEVSDNSLYANIKRWLKNGHLIQLKKGCYVTEEYFQNLSDRDIYRSFVANKLREPSYLSLEYVLQKHNILTEAVVAFTSVTLKSSRIYKNKLGIYIYRNLKEDLFRGYRILSRNSFNIREATKAKALFDYFYLKFWRRKEIDREVLQSLRLNLGEFSASDLREFSQYCEESRFKKFIVLPKLIRALR